MALKNNLIPLSIFIVFAAILGLLRLTTQPSLTRDWRPDQALLAAVNVYGDDVVIGNIRNTDFRAGENAAPSYVDHTVNLTSLRRAWLVMEDLGWGQSQAMIDFEFQNSGHIMITPTPRLEKGESYSPLMGLFRRYELVYMITSEFDQITLCAVARGHAVSMYELQLDAAARQKLFLSMTGRASQLAREPEFYHTIFKNGAGGILKHLKTLGKRKVSGSLLLSEHLPERVYDMRLMRQDTPLKYLRGKGSVSEAARKWQEGEDFTAKMHAASDGIQEEL